MGAIPFRGKNRIKKTILYKRTYTMTQTTCVPSPFGGGTGWGAVNKVKI